MALSKTKGLATGVLLAFILETGAAVAAEVYKFDQGHTEIGFGWSHAGVSMQHGEFIKAEGTLTLDPEKIEASKISVTIDAKSVSTGVTALDTHLKSSDFLDVEKHPTISFQSTSVTKTGAASADVSGDLTLHGVTKPVTLKVKLTHRGSHPVGQYIAHYKGSWVAFAAETVINHLEFGVGSYPAGPNDKIMIKINTEMKYQQ
ncbi:MAG: YceI family protein [Alphaproteobacteria bacterium]|nr:YceI family protein [Alphaproteobacteria bacterium]